MVVELVAGDAVEVAVGVETFLIVDTCDVIVVVTAVTVDVVFKSLVVLQNPHVMLQYIVWQ